MDDSLERIKNVILSTLKCSMCQNFLSVDPEDGEQLQCRRCKDVPEKTLRWSSTLIKIAQEFSFPCINEGCGALVPWNKLQKHKEMCNGRSVKCPINYNDACKMVKKKELVEHLHRIHGCNIFFDTVTQKLDGIREMISVVIFKNHMFFLQTRINSNFEILITMLNNSENMDMSFTYNVKLSNESNNTTILSDNHQIETLDKGKYCLACWLKKCSIHSSIEKKQSKRQQNVTIISFDLLRLTSLFGIGSTSGIKYSIEIVAFEKIAQELSVPCKYEGCTASVPWNEVQKHEEMCDERFVKCPFNKCSKCTFVKIKGLVEHLRNEHESNVFCDTLTHKSNATIKNVIAVLTFKNHIFFVLTGGDPDFRILVTMLNNNLNTDMSFTYNVMLSNESNKTIISYKNQQIDLLTEGKCSFARALTNCPFHSELSIMLGFKCPQNGIKEINLPLLSQFFGIDDTSGIKYSVEIVAVENRLENKEVTNEISSIQTNNLRNMLQCPICMEYMIGHIFSCENGHVLCHTCKTQVTTCPTCRVTLGILRCIPLENLADFLLLDCFFAEKGCNFSGKVNILFQHEKECNYKADRTQNPRESMRTPQQIVEIHGFPRLFSILDIH